MTQAITNFVKHCHICQQNKKPTQKIFGFLQAIPATDLPFEGLSIDTVGRCNYYNSTKKNICI